MAVEAEEFKSEVGRRLRSVADVGYPAPQEGQFQGEDGPMDFIEAPDLGEIGAHLIQTCEEFRHLRELTVVFLWKREGGEKQGQAKLGFCYKPNGMVKHFSSAQWVIWVAADHCRDCAITRPQLESLLHHELCHAGEKLDKEGNGKPSVCGHDFDGFCKNVERYGCWQENLQMAARTFRQAALPGV